MIDFDLCYVWIKKFKNIQEQGFSFGGQYSFEYILGDSKIEIKKNKSHQFPFFVSKNWNQGDGIVTSVTAIIGENGSGKSSMLEFFCELLNAGDSFRPARKIVDDIIIFEYQKRFFVYHQNKLKKFEIFQKPEKFILDLNKPDEEFPLNRDNAISHFLISILYSTTWVDRITFREPKEWELINISNSHYFYYGHFPPTITDLIRENSYLIVDYPSRHLSEDSKRQLFFLDKYYEWIKNEFGLKQLHNVGVGIIQKHTHNDIRLKELFDILFKAYPPENDYEFSKLFFSTASLFYYVFTRKNSLLVDEKVFKDKFISAIKRNPTSSLDAFIDFLRNHPLNIPPNISFHKWFDDREVKSKLNDFKIPETIEYLMFIDTYFNSEHLSFTDNSRLPLKDYIKNHTFNPIVFQIDYNIIILFLNKYLNHLERDVTPDYLYFESLDYSSGELSLLNLFSRLPHISKYVIDEFERFNMVRYTKTQSILLLIDEGETYFHPQWHKHFLSALLKFIEKIFKGKRIQIILTSHSPLFISDLPKNNIVFTKREQETGSCVVTNFNKHDETFGSNIYTLYSDSFFIKDGLIGDFAKEKIINTTKRLSDNNKLSDDEQSEIKKIIDIIGEPVWRLKLNEMFESKIQK